MDWIQLLPHQYTTIKPKVDVQQVFIRNKPALDKPWISLLWINFNEKKFSKRSAISFLRRSLGKKRRRSKFSHENKKHSFYTTPGNKLVKTIMDTATLISLVAGIGRITKKVVKHAKFSAVMDDSIVLKQYLRDQKILQSNLWYITMTTQTFPRLTQAAKLVLAQNTDKLPSDIDVAFMRFFKEK